MLKPKKLQAGDTLAAISLSWGGAHTYMHRYLAGKHQLETTFGVQVVESRYALRDPAWLARNPQARAEDLLEAFANPAIAGIVSTIGGDDSIRILPYVDPTVITQNPKVFLGYSDTTITHFICYKAGLVSFYGPSILAGFAENGGLFPYTIASVQRTLFSAEPIGAVPPNMAGWTTEFLDWGQPELQQQRRTVRPTTGWRWLQGQGTVSGPLIGGCLDVLDWLRGTTYWPALTAWNKAVLFVETSEDAPAPTAVRRVLRSFAAVGMLHQLGALLFGRPGGIVEPDQQRAYDATLRQVITDECGLSHLPIITNMDFGHTDPMMILPYGVQAHLDCDRQAFTITESAVVEP